MPTDSRRVWTVVVTRDEPSNGPLSRRFRDAGFDVIVCPTVEVGPPAQTDELDRCVADLARYDWVAVTSPRAIDALVERDVVWPRNVDLAAVGQATARRAGRMGVRPRVVGGEGAEVLGRAMVQAGVGRGDRVLFPCGDLAGDELERILVAAGASVDRVVVYETRTRRIEPHERAALGRADVVTFTSPSAVQGWVESAEGSARGIIPPAVRYVVIGETTAGAARAAGLDPIVADRTTLDGVVDAALALRGPD